MTYEEISDRFRLSICWGGGDCRYTISQHRVGHHGNDGKIHWYRREVVKPGLRRFLKLAMSSQLGLRYMDEPERTYWAAAGADTLAHELHVRFPRRYADLDRAIVREGTARSDPRRGDTEDDHQMVKMSRTRPLDQVDISAEVASVLPSLAAEGRKRAIYQESRTTRQRTLQTTVCPVCGGMKSSKAAVTCRGCMRVDRKGRPINAGSIVERLPHPSPAFADVRSTFHVHSAGADRPQPKRPRMVLTNGRWIPDATTD